LRRVRISHGNQSSKSAKKESVAENPGIWNYFHALTKQMRGAEDHDAPLATCRREFRGGDEIKLRKYFNYKFCFERETRHMR
jgi:hypothetical protein